MMDKIAMLWAHSPKEAAGMIAVAITCSAMMAALLALLMWPQETDRMEEAR